MVEVKKLREQVQFDYDRGLIDADWYNYVMMTMRLWESVQA